MPPDPLIEPPHFDRNPTRYDPDHSVDGPPETWPHRPWAPDPEPGRSWWVRLIRLAARLVRWLLRRGKQ